MIDAETKLCCLIGKPVEHSLSPAMHNAAFKKLGLNFAYTAFNVEKPKLPGAVKSLKTLSFRGANITIPHKERVIRLLDELDSSAQKTNAVNTILNENGKLKGFNTDGIGSIKALKEKTSLRNKNISVCGAGGASRAICFSLLKERIGKLSIFDIDSLKASTLTKSLAQNANAELPEIISMNSKQEFNQGIEESDILINASPIGLFPKTNETPIPKNAFHSKLLAFDIVYNPIKTKFLREAEESGSQTLSGERMLLFQGAASFEIWTNKKAPIKIMHKTILEQLERKK